MPTQVVRLGAWCDLVSEDAAARRRQFRVGEFAVLADGRRIDLHADRGWTDALHVVGGPAPNDLDVWQYESREVLERGVLSVVLPDDAEETGEDHSWEWLCQLLRARGVDASEEELRLLPYVVELSDRVRTRLRPEGERP